MTFRQKLFYRFFWQGFSRRLLEHVVPVSGVGTENVPPKGNYLVISNHRCWLDPVFISFVIPRPIQWAGIDFHYKMPVVRQIARASGMIPVNVEGGRRSRQSLKMAARLLKEEKDLLVGIFPEGASNFLNPSKEKIIRFHTGFARIALEAKVDLIPVAVKGYGEEELMAVPGSIVQLFTPVEAFKQGVHLLIYKEAFVNIGPPISMNPYLHREVNIDLLHEMSARARAVIKDLYDRI